jgi:S-adenosylmethionine decarboxylase proenzyme
MIWHRYILHLINFSKVENILTSAIKKTDCTIIGKQEKKFEPQGLTIVYVLSESHMSIHTWPEYNACAIDFYNCGP